MTIRQLTSAQLRRTCDPNQFNFETTADLNPTSVGLMGQPRATKALQFGVGIPSAGYNIYVLGNSSMGHREMVEEFLRDVAAKQPVPNDWLYVHNFETNQKPQAIQLPAGDGSTFCKEMEEMLTTHKKELPEAFETEEYLNASDKIRQAYKNERDGLVETLREQVGEDGLTVVRTSTGLSIVPLVEGRAMTNDEIDQLPVNEQSEWQKKSQNWDEELDDTVRKIRDLDTKTSDEMNELEREIASSSINQKYEELKTKYADHEQVVGYLEKSFDDVVDNLSDFFPGEKDDSSADLRRYEVNLLVDNSELEGAPVITELNPRYHTLMGRIEYESQHTTHFSNIRPGALHKANGGYLVVNVSQLLSSRNGWDSLRRALTTKEILLQPSDRADGNQVLTKSLDPAPIPLNLKVILIGDHDIWYRLYSREEDFQQLFKVKAEFSDFMLRTAENELAYAEYVATCCRKENLRPFDRSAVASIVDYGSWYQEHQDRLTTDFVGLADIIRESCYWAGAAGREVVNAADVQTAIDEYNYRVNLKEEYELDRIKFQRRMIDTAGCKVGQVNGLSVWDWPDHPYGAPNRVTARTWQGDSAIIHIERETEMAGPSHNKGLLTLIGFLGGQYAQDQGLNFSASLTFEQSYGGTDGDSATAAELIALLSSLGDFPIKQNIAITGSLNQLGEMQVIGGVNEKVQGFFKVCAARGLTGDQGVILPLINECDLMLDQEVVDAVAAGKFHLWVVETIFDALEIITDLKILPADDDGIYPEGSLHALVLEGLDRLDSDDDEDDDEEEEDTDEAESDA